MDPTLDLKPNTFFIELSGAGTPEVDGLFVPSTAPPAESEIRDDFECGILEWKNGVGSSGWQE